MATSSNVRISPRKARQVIHSIKKMNLVNAQNALELLAKKGARPILKTLKSAVANATNNKKLKIEDLKIKNILVDEGLKMKRRDMSHGARYGGGLIQKRTSHIRVILEG